MYITLFQCCKLLQHRLKILGNQQSLLLFPIVILKMCSYSEGQMTFRFFLMTVKWTYLLLLDPDMLDQSSLRLKSGPSNFLYSLKLWYAYSPHHGYILYWLTNLSHCTGKNRSSHGSLAWHQTHVIILSVSTWRPEHAGRNIGLISVFKYVASW